VTQANQARPRLLPDGSGVRHRAPDPAVPAPRGRSLRRHKTITGLVLVSPASLLVALFVLFPLGFAIYISVTDWPLIGGYHFTGGANYSRLIHDPVFLHSIVFTLLYTGIVTIPIFGVGYLLAVLVRANRFGSVFFRTAFFLPFVVGLATESFMVLLELQPNSGLVNVITGKLGLAAESTAWTVHTWLALGVISVFVVWFASGLTMMVLMAGMQGISPELYNAADVDGASWWTKELKITVPLLRRNIALSLIVSVIGSFLAFSQFFILTQGGPGTSTYTVVTWIYEEAFIQFHVGYATAGAVVLVAVTGLISAVQFFLLRDEEGRTR
jgi:multiple sugar transport system permease protein